MLAEKVDLELKDWDFLDDIGACNIFLFLKKRKIIIIIIILSNCH